MPMTTQQYNEYVDQVVETALANTAAFAKVMEARDRQAALNRPTSPSIQDQRTNLDRYEDGMRASCERYARDLELRKAMGR
jgi:hypothetical protein